MLGGLDRAKEKTDLAEAVEAVDDQDESKPQKVKKVNSKLFIIMIKDKL